MKIKNIKTLNSLLKKNKKQYLDDNISEFENDFITQESLNLETILDRLKDNKILIKNNENVVIVFENFNWANDFLYRIKNLFNNNIIQGAAYNKETQSIHITKELLEKELKSEHTFTEHLFKKIELQDFVNIVVLHEMGHAFNHGHILETGKNLTELSKTNIFFNKTVLADKYPNIPQLDNTDYLNPSRNIFLATSEGFADLYCTIAITQLYPQEKAINLIEAIIESRKKADDYNREYYQTQGMLNQFLNDFKNNDIKVQFKDFSQMYDYMSSVIGEQALVTLSSHLTHTGKIEQTFNSQYLGFINGYLGLNAVTPQGTIQKINNQYSFNLPITASYNQQLFDHWTNQGQNFTLQDNLKKTGNKMKIEATIYQLRESNNSVANQKINYKA